MPQGQPKYLQQSKANTPARHRPYAMLNAIVGGITTGVMSGKVFLADLPNVGDYITVRWHNGGSVFATTHQVLDVDTEKSGDMWLLTHWKGWLS